MFRRRDTVNKKKIERYVEACDRLNAPMLMDDQTLIDPIRRPFPFIQPYKLELNEDSEVDHFTIAITNAGEGFLILSRVYADSDWLKVQAPKEKIAVENSDGPVNIEVLIDRSRLPRGPQVGNVFIEVRADESETYQVPIYIDVPKDEAASITFSPELLDFGDVFVHKEVELCYQNSSNKDVFVQGDFTGWTKIPMQRGPDGAFYVCLSLDDGQYLYQFVVDGREIPDPNNNESVITSEHGACSRLTLKRFSRPLIISNVTKRDVSLRLVTSEEYLKLSETELTVHKGERKTVQVQIQPEDVKLGQNISHIDVYLGSKLVSTIAVKANGKSKGPFAEVLSESIELGEVFKGGSYLIGMRVRNSGNAVSNISIKCEELSLEAMDYQIPEGVELDIPLPVRYDDMDPGTYRAQIVVKSDNYVYGTDTSVVPISFNLISMETDVEELDFGTLYRGQSKELQVRARRSDGAKLSLTVGESLPSWLNVLPSGRQSISVSINWDELHLESDLELETELLLADFNTPLKKVLKVRGKILIPHIVVEELNFESHVKKLPLNLKNIGNGKLIIYKMEIDESQKWLNISLKRKGNTPIFYVSVNRRRIPKDAENPVTGVIRIYSNDPVEPVAHVFVTVNL